MLNRISLYFCILVLVFSTNTFSQIKSDLILQQVKFFQGVWTQGDYTTDEGRVKIIKWNDIYCKVDGIKLTLSDGTTYTIKEVKKQVDEDEGTTYYVITFNEISRNWIVDVIGQNIIMISNSTSGNRIMCRINH